MVNVLGTEGFAGCISVDERELLRTVELKDILSSPGRQGGQSERLRRTHRGLGGRFTCVLIPRRPCRVG